MKETNPKDQRMRKVSLLMERFWLVVTIAALVVVLYHFWSDGVTANTLQFLVFPALAGLMYAFRRTFRKRLERRDS